MKHYLILLIALIGLNNVSNAQTEDTTINWLTFEEALKLNEQEPKKFFIDFYTTWCGPCKRLDMYTFTDKEVIKKLNATYYPIKFNAEHRDTISFQNKDFIFVRPPESRRGYHTLAAAILNGKLAYPTMTILNIKPGSNEVEILNYIPGYVEPPTLLPVLDFFRDDMHKKGVDWNTYKANYKK